MNSYCLFINFQTTTISWQRQFCWNIGLHPNTYALEQKECEHLHLLFVFINFLYLIDRVVFHPTCSNLHLWETVSEQKKVTPWVHSVLQSSYSSSDIKTISKLMVIQLQKDITAMRLFVLFWCVLCHREVYRAVRMTDLKTRPQASKPNAWPTACCYRFAVWLLFNVSSNSRFL